MIYTYKDREKVKSPFCFYDKTLELGTSKGMIIYGIGIGILTVVIRQWGGYPEGVSFAILIMNAFTPLINNYIKPKRFGNHRS